MSKSNSFATQDLKVFPKDTMARGQPAKVDCVEICGQNYAVSRGLVTTLCLEDDWFEDVANPAAVIDALTKSSGFKADIFTFWQRLPDTEPKHSFHTEWEELATLPIRNYDHWWNHQIKSRVRNQIRKAEKQGLVVRAATYDDDFVRGMTAIFNEAPVRQGRKFWHYGKDFQTIKRQFSRNIHREDMIGAYFENELIGFIMLANAERYGVTTQIISAIKHRDKNTNNAMIAKAVEVCERKGLGHLVYLYWGDDSLAEFKRRCGFERTRIPRYFVPLTQKGKVAMQLGLHRGWKELVPKQVRESLTRLRSNWYGHNGAE
jgi:Acetyltransferase (GNAT) family